MLKRVVLVATIFSTLAIPAVARADGYIGPGIGVAFGNPSARGLADFVLDACWLYQDPIGAEVDMTLAPGFFNNQAYGSNGVTTIMGNVVIAAREPGPRLPRGLHRGNTTRPYVSGGFGWIRESTSAPNMARNDLGADIGVGVLASAASNVAVRGDLRYFRDIVGSSDGKNSSIDFGGFHFWRGSVAILFRF